MNAACTSIRMLHLLECVLAVAEFNGNPRARRLHSTSPTVSLHTRAKTVRVRTVINANIDFESDSCFHPPQ